MVVAASVSTSMSYRASTSSSVRLPRKGGGRALDESQGDLVVRLDGLGDGAELGGQESGQADVRVLVQEIVREDHYEGRAFLATLDLVRRFLHPYLPVCRAEHLYDDLAQDGDVTAPNLDELVEPANAVVVCPASTVGEVLADGVAEAGRLIEADGSLWQRAAGVLHVVVELLADFVGRQELERVEGLLRTSIRICEAISIELGQQA